MGPSAFERESFVPVRTFLTFVCTSKGSEIQRVSDFAQPLHSKFSEFQKYRNGTNSIRKRVVCTRLYLKGFGDTTILKFKITNENKRDTNGYKRFSFEWHK